MGNAAPRACAAAHVRLKCAAAPGSVCVVILAASRTVPGGRERHAASEEGSGTCTACVRSAARVFCGGEHTLLRDPETLEVFQLGACGLGFNHNDAAAAANAANYARQVPLPGAASGVFAGYYHNLFRLNGGRCFAYGCGRQAPNDGQLCNGSLAEETQPTLTQLRFADAAIGGHHSLCRTRSGEVWVCGAGWQGQMGDSSLRYKNPEPARVAGIPVPVQSVASGYYHNAALTEDGRTFVWGCNEQGQLGALSVGNQVTSPQELRDLVPGLPAFAQGRVLAFDGGYGHSVLLLNGGRLLAMGNHSEGQRALDPNTDEDPPLANEVSALPGLVDAIAAGSHHTLAVVGGRVFAFGSDEYGQVSGLGMPSDEEQLTWQPKPVQGLPAVETDPVIRVSAGICHSAAQTASGRVFVWGCGGNGQTGEGTLPESSPVKELFISEVARQCKSRSAA